MVQTLTRALKNARRGYESEGLGRIGRDVDVTHQYSKVWPARRKFILLGPRLGPRWTLEATLPFGSTTRRDHEPRIWPYDIQHHYQREREVINDRPRIAIQDPADRHGTKETSHEIEV